VPRARPWPACARSTTACWGNGYCTRPVELDCAFETICEGCTFFATTIEFRPTLRRQHRDAERKNQVGRATTYKNLLDGLETSGEPIS
jgi:integrase/recombinase XerD